MSELSRVEDLSQRVADGLANDDVIAELERLMRDDPQARIVYLQTLQLHDDLDRKAARGTLSEQPVFAALPADTPQRPRRRFVPYLALAISVVVLAAVAWQQNWFAIGTPVIATVTRLENVDKAFAYRQPLSQGEQIAFEHGILELTYQNGTRLIVEGPARYTLTKSNAGRLDLGTLAAEVPPQASGFTVVTPTVEVKDIGTRFAVVQLETGRAEFEVFAGEIEAKSATTGSNSKSFTDGQSAALDAGKVEIQSIPTDPGRFQGVHNALNQRNVEAVSDCFVQAGKFADVVPIDAPRVLLLKQLGGVNDVARKAWIRFDLSGQQVHPLQPATLTLHVARVDRRANWSVQLYGLKKGYVGQGRSLGIDWQDDKMTWNNAPGNDTKSPVKMSRAAALITSGEIRVEQNNAVGGAFYTFTIPSLEPFLQEDGSVTLMLSTVTKRHQVLNLAARDHEEFPGPFLTVEVLPDEID